MNLFGMMDLSGNAMQAERMRAEVVAANMANSETTKTPNGTAYRRQHVVFASGGGDTGFAGQLNSALPPALLPFASGDMGTKVGFPSVLPSFESARFPGGLSSINSGAAPGLHIAGVIEDKAPPLKRYDPSHPDADAEGYVSYPDINPLTEMVDLMGATRAYGLNNSAVQAEKTMIASALEIGK